jgi:2-dehydro-3-deoxyphosphogalactonate aldolase
MTLDDALDACPIVAILRGVTPGDVLAHAEALFQAGVRAMEAPLNSPEPFESVSRLVAAFGDRMAVGGGTVIAPADVDRLASSGASFIVSPNTDAEVIGMALSLNLDPVPGFATASEAFTALKAGARHLKLFPAGSLGAPFLKQLKAVLPQRARVWAVGAVGPSDITTWLAAGAYAFGLGGELYRAGQGPDETAKRAQDAVSAVRRLV